MGALIFFCLVSEQVHLTIGLAMTYHSVDLE